MKARTAETILMISTSNSIEIWTLAIGIISFRQGPWPRALTLCILFAPWLALSQLCDQHNREFGHYWGLNVSNEPPGVGGKGIYSGPNLGLAGVTISDTGAGVPRLTGGLTGPVPHPKEGVSVLPGGWLSLTFWFYEKQQHF